MKITKIAYSKKLNPGKYAALLELASLLGEVRSEVWIRESGFGGSLNTVAEWMASGLGSSFGTLANPWKMTVRDAVADIDASMASAKVSVKRLIWARTEDPVERKRLFTLLKSGQWEKDAWLHRAMRKAWSGGRTSVANQIVVRSDNYTVRGRWLAVPGLVRNKTIKIPLGYEIPEGRNLRLILRSGRVEVHYSETVESDGSCGNRVIGVDKGYTEVLVDSDANHHGLGLGALLTKDSDRKKVRGRRRAKLRSIANNTANKTKAERIRANNLGRKKLESQQKAHKAVERTLIYTAVNRVVDKASEVVVEDLTKNFESKRSLGRNTNRRLSGWTKGVMATALKDVSDRRGSVVRLVNAAYTSQWCSTCEGGFGVRSGDKFSCTHCGIVCQADENAAVNIKNRLGDPDITQWTPYREVKKILMERSQRLRLPNQDTSCSDSSAINSERNILTTDILACP